jgi:hypothetical protein
MIDEVSIILFAMLWFGLGAKLFYNAYLKKDWWK